MAQQPPLPVRRDVYHPAGREPAAPGGREAFEVTEQRPLVVQIGGVLDPGPGARLLAGVRGPAEPRLRPRDGIEHDVLLRLRQGPIPAATAVTPAGHIK